MRTFIDTNYAMQVVNTDVVHNDIEIPNGVTLHITAFDVSAVNLANIFVQLVWDFGGESEEVFFECSGNGNFHNLDLQKSGDGVKKLSIVFEHHNESVGSVGLSANVAGYYS